MKKESKIYVAGHNGLVGSAILKGLKQKGYTSFLLRTHKELDLTDQHAVNEFFAEEKPEYVFLAAAHVGGIMANFKYRADFIYQNLMIQNHVIHAAYRNKVKKLLFLGSTCIYPKESSQPMTEDCLLTSPLEYTNEPYAIAKIAGIKMCESYNLQYGTNFLSVMPTNLYGPHDNFDLEKSHVLPAMVRKLFLAKALMQEQWDLIRKDMEVRPVTGYCKEWTNEKIEEELQKYNIYRNRVELWGTGKPMREFLWSEDMADACIYIMEKINFQDIVPSGYEIRNTHINIGTGKDSTIGEIAQQLKTIVGYEGTITFDTSKPDGTFRKLTDVNRLHSLGWKHKMELPEGLERIFHWYVDSVRMDNL